MEATRASSDKSQGSRTRRKYKKISLSLDGARENSRDGTSRVARKSLGGYMRVRYF